MSQLDVSISFSHLASLLFVFYVFVHYVCYILIHYWYNFKFRFFKSVEFGNISESVDNSVLLRKMLKI